jgi:hypothetical protein
VLSLLAILPSRIHKNEYLRTTQVVFGGKFIYGKELHKIPKKGINSSGIGEFLRSLHIYSPKSS